MKKVLSGLIALVFAVVAFAFTNKVNAVNKPTDVCAAANKQWFLINLDCSSQMLDGIRNQLNYSISSFDEVGTTCTGSECVCAILACPMIVSGTTRPNIGTSTDIYLHLTNYFKFGTIYGDIESKDQQ